MDANIFLDRVKKTQIRMSSSGTDAMLISPSSNLYYLSGYPSKGDKRLFLLVIPKCESKEPFIFANRLYKDQITSLPFKDIVCWKDGEDPFALIKAEIEKRGLPFSSAALEPQIPALFSLPLLKTFPSTQFSLAGPIIDRQRNIKEPGELDKMRQAGKCSDKALAAVIERGSYWLGKTELEFQEALFSELAALGLDSYGAVVAVGANAAIPHHDCGHTVIEKGKCLLVDFWSRFNGYYTDCTRTFHFGSPPEEFAKIHAIVLEAHLAAEAAASPGALLGDVDKAARSVIEKYGYGEYFTHRTGHGAGLDVHEGDSVAQGVQSKVEPGMVFSIEPGIYLPDRYGVRIENLVTIGEDGAQALHGYPRELKVID
ncbi:MAG: Xaa-Pro peptidase family protein [Treponema sp.]|jgi:Xaa-Pro aminopeptidase|nr:Xaa-Pro peptidase family protein [Treponema sp.]